MLRVAWVPLQAITLSLSADVRGNTDGGVVKPEARPAAAIATNTPPEKYA